MVVKFYQYVGDEVVISWKTNSKNKEHCLNFIRQAMEAISKKKKIYSTRYGFAPTFKTGIHAGDVTAGYIGIIKKELVYSGDTLNTTARIRSKCHELNHSYVFSAGFLDGFTVPPIFRSDEIGEMFLKGREEKEKLYSLVF